MAKSESDVRDVQRGAIAPSARSVGANVLVRVFRDGAFAAAALDADLDRNVQLDARERALATELVYGTLRLRGWLEKRVGRYATKGTASLDVHVRAHMLLAAYQLLVLTRVPAFAAVSEAVTAIRRLRGDRVGGFANAVLRKVAKDPRPTEDELARATLDGADPDLARAIIAAVGEDAALRLLSASAPPPFGIRVEDPTSRDAWLARLREARPGASIELGKVSPLALLVHGAGRVVDLPGLSEGAWSPQEEGSQVVALSLGANPGEAVLDACAGRGNKTGLLARAVGPSGRVDAADLHEKKLDILKSELERIGLAAHATHAVDWSTGAGDITGPYDRILVDAPCSGTGTLRRRPEILLRRVAADLPKLADLQRTLLSRAAGLVRPGGRVVNAVCSILREEGEEVVADAARVGLEPAPFDWEGRARVAAFRLLPHEHGTDGYFVASLIRRGGA